MKNDIICEDLLKKIICKYNRRINLQIELLQHKEIDDILEGEIIMLEWLLGELRELGLDTSIRKIMMEVNGSGYLS